MKSSKYHLVSSKFFWSVIAIPAVFLALCALLIAKYTSILSLDLGWVILLFVTILLQVMISVPALAIVALNQRNQLAFEHNQLLQKQLDFERYFQHVGHFTAHMNPELLKRLGISAQNLYQLSFPRGRDGDFSLNSRLFKFIHHSFAEIDQAAQVVERLAASLDDDEQAVSQNRLEFVFNQSVYLVFFIADKFKGQAPDCQDFYFLKDALADDYDFIMAVAYFDGNEEHKYNLRAFNLLFNDKTMKSWFNRNNTFLQQACDLAVADNPLNKTFDKW